MLQVDAPKVDLMPKAEGSLFALIWKPTFYDAKKKPYVIGESTADKLETLTKSDGKSSLKDMYNQTFSGSLRNTPVTTDAASPKNADFLTALLTSSHTTQLVLPLSSSIVHTKEYSYQLPNRVLQQQTLLGNSTVTFGRGIKKIALKTVIVKLGSHWAPYVAALEALTEISGNGYRYNGSLFLYGYNQSNPGTARKYRVTIESLSHNMSSDTNNLINYDINMIVNHDYSGQRLGVLGKL